MNGENKEAVIKYRIQRSKQTIDEARLAFDNGKFNLTLNRIYYSIFYIVSALALKNDFSTSKHKQLMGWFNLNYVNTGKVAVNFGKTYKNVFDKRQESDYDDFSEFEKLDVEQYFNETLLFVEEIEKILNEN